MRERIPEGEKRGHARRDLAVAARISGGEGWHDCRIINISPGGAKLQVASPLAEEAQVRLEIADLGEYGCRVVWQRGGEVGVEFVHDPVEMADVIMAVAMYG